MKRQTSESTVEVEDGVMVPPGQWSAKDYSEKEHESFSAYRSHLFEAISYCTGGSSWRTDLEGTRLSSFAHHELDQGFDPIEVQLHFDPNFKCIFARAREFRAVRKSISLGRETPKEFVARRSKQTNCRLSFEEREGSFWVGVWHCRDRPQNGVKLKDLVALVIGDVNEVVAEAHFLRESIGHRLLA